MKRRIHARTSGAPEWMSSEDAVVFFGLGRWQTMVVAVGLSFSAVIRGSRIGAVFQNWRGAGRPCLWNARLGTKTRTLSQAPKATLVRSSSMVVVRGRAILGVFVCESGPEKRRLFTLLEKWNQSPLGQHKGLVM